MAPLPSEIRAARKELDSAMETLDSAIRAYTARWPWRDAGRPARDAIPVHDTAPRAARNDHGAPDQTDTKAREKVGDRSADPGTPGKSMPANLWARTRELISLIPRWWGAGS